MKVLGLCTYPIEAAATRYRLYQYVEPLKAEGIELTVKPFLTGIQFSELYRSGHALSKAIGVAGSVARRVFEISAIKNFDLLLVQREAMFLGPAMFEWIYQYIGKMPMVLDLDDATYIPYTSPVYGKLGSSLKFFGKTDRMIKRSSAVICGNRFIAEHAEQLGAITAVIPTVVDLAEFVPIGKSDPMPVIGWIGTHSTFPFLQTLFPVIRRLAEKYQFQLKIVGSGVDNIKVEGVDVIAKPWVLAGEIADFQSLDIGLYPLAQTEIVGQEWLAGKSGFKAVQYMAVGIPFVMTPVGVCAELGLAGQTHFNAETPDEWYDALESLLTKTDERKAAGARGRRYAEKNFDLIIQAGKLADVLRSAAAN
jgi:glycosyltransferase involved in cell wall biosynthesis